MQELAGVAGSDETPANSDNKAQTSEFEKATSRSFVTVEVSELDVNACLYEYREREAKGEEREFQRFCATQGFSLTDALVLNY